MTRCLLLLSVCLLCSAAAADPRLAKASRKPERNGWVQVHLEGTPAEIGYQHGVLLKAGIVDTLKVARFELQRDEAQPWQFFRDAARDNLWPLVEPEYRAEMQGIAEGSGQDLWDIVALNAWEEFSYYTGWLKKPLKSRAPEHCSAFVATGSYTKDGGVVIGHNNWTSYASGERWNIVYDIVPAQGHRILMDGMPGVIHSADDFGINSAGLAITETTISGFHGWDPKGIPEFVRARKAMQYAASIDDFARIMSEGNNGGYANNWLLADRKTGEVASLELGLLHVTLKRTRDGYFVGANYPIDPKLAAEETDFNLNDPTLSPNARRKRWEQLMKTSKGNIDVAAGQKFLGDHLDTETGAETANERTLCGHIDLSPRGVKDWKGPFAPAGAVQNKVADAAGMAKMEFTAALGHACGIDFKVAQHLKEHPEFAAEKAILRDMPARGWTLVKADAKADAR